MEKILNIMKLLPDHWADVLKQSEEFEIKLESGEHFIEKNKETIDSFINHLFDNIIIDKVKIKEGFHASGFYQKCSGLNIDFVTFFSLPNGSNYDGIGDISLIVQEKMTFLLKELSELKLEQFELDLLLAEVQKILQIMLDVPDHFDFNDLEAVVQFKNEQLILLKPRIISLLYLLVKIDLSDSPMNTGLTKLNNVSDIIFTGNNELPKNPLEFISAIKSKVPQIENELLELGIEEIDMPKISHISSDLLSSVENKIPLLEEQFKAIDWTNLEAKNITSKGKLIFNILSDILNQPGFSDIIGMLKDQFGLFGFKNMTAETVIAKLIELFQLPEDIGQSDLNDILHIIKNKFSQLIELVESIEVDGIDVKGQMNELKKSIDGIFKIPKNLKLDGVSDLLQMLLNNGISISDEYLSQANKEFGKAGSLILDQAKKTHTIWKFIKSSGINISIKDKVERNRPGAASYSMIDQTVENVTFSHETIGSRNNHQETGAGKESKHSEESNIDISWEDWLKILLGNREKGLISLLKPEQAKMVETLLNGTLQKEIKEGFLDILWDKQFISNLENKKNDFIHLLKQDKTPSLGILMDFLLNVLIDTISIILEKLKQLTLMLVDVPYRLISLLIKVIKKAKIPKELIPDWAYKFITFGKEPNLLCLILALPVSTIKELLEFSLDDSKKLDVRSSTLSLFYE